ETDPFHNPFENDLFSLHRFALHGVHEWDISANATLTTNVYHQQIDRVSYRQIDDSVDDMTANPATGCVGDAREDYDNFAHLCGNKMRPRAYSFWGIAPELSLNGEVLGSLNELVVGARYHDEVADRRRYNGLTPGARETSE